MEFNTETLGDVSIISVKGSLDAITAPEMGGWFSKEIRAGKVRLVADLNGVDYSSSAGLRALLGATKEARRNGGDLRMAAIQPNVFKVLELSGFTSIIKNFKTIEEAVQSYEEEE